MGISNTSNLLLVGSIIILNTGYPIDALYPEMTYVSQHYLMDQPYDLDPYLQEN